MKKTAYQEMYENELSHGWYLGTRAHLIKTLKQNIKTSSRILDAGAGTGGTIMFLQKAGFKNVVGVEKSDIAIDYARQRGISVKKGDIGKLPFEKDSFDVVICLDVLYHQGVNSSLAIKECQRVLKKDGLLYLQEPAYNFLKSKHDLAISTKRRFTKDRITKMLAPKEFKILKLTYFNTLMFLPIAIKRLFEKFLKEKEISSDVAPLNPTLNKLITVILGLESFLLSYINLPFGLSVICLAKKT